MAKIEDLIAQIPDERLKKAIGAEVRELKKNKKFGLVFEEHLPETVRLPKLPVKDGELVAKKRESGNELWRVKKISKGIATLEKAIERYPLPNLYAINFVVRGLLAGGAIASLRFDRQAKALGEFLRARHVDLPRALLAKGSAL